MHEMFPLLMITITIIELINCPICTYAAKSAEVPILVIYGSNSQKINNSDGAVEIHLSSDSKGSLDTLITAIGVIGGAIAGSVFTSFAGSVREKPISKSIRELVLYELQSYRDFLQQNIDKSNSVYKIFSEKYSEADEIIKKFKISYYMSMQEERKIQIFKKSSYPQVNLAYMTLRTYIDYLTKERSSLHRVFITIDKKETDELVQIIDAAITHLKGKVF
jgi:hypothetical protein